MQRHSSRYRSIVMLRVACFFCFALAAHELFSNMSLSCLFVFAARGRCAYLNPQFLRSIFDRLFCFCAVEHDAQLLLLSHLALSHAAQAVLLSHFALENAAQALLPSP